MVRVQTCTQKGDWIGVIRACADDLQQLPELGMDHHAALHGVDSGRIAAKAWPGGRLRAK